MNKTKNSKTWPNKRFKWKLAQIYHLSKMILSLKRRRNLRNTKNLRNLRPSSERRKGFRSKEKRAIEKGMLVVAINLITL